MPQPTRYVLFQVTNPLRRPAWRYERALEAAKPRQFRTEEDADVRELVRMLRMIRNSSARGDLQDSVRVFYRFPHYFRAYELYQSGAEGHSHSKAAIEARLLAGQSSEDIAGCMSMTPEAVDIYERVFFNVRDRLKNKDYIVGQVLTPSAGENLADFTPKFFGYFGGPFVVEVVLHKFDESSGRPKNLDNVKGFMTGYVEKTLERRLAEAINTVTLDKFNVVPLLEIHARITQDMRHREAESAIGGSEYEQNMKAWMDVAVPWSIGSENRTTIIETFGEDKFAGAMEPRANELLAITDGVELPKLNYTLDRDKDKETNRGKKTKLRRRKQVSPGTGEGAES